MSSAPRGSRAQAFASSHPAHPPAPTLELVVPVYNEERCLATSIRELCAFMHSHVTAAYCITIADNASTDDTLAIAKELAEELPEVHTVHLPERGRGRALRTTWLASDADVVAYTDVDLSTDLTALPELLAPLIAGTADVAIGTRLALGAEVTRGLKREVVSRAYNILLRFLLDVSFSDAQCGFKAARRTTVAPLLERVQDDAWFFDTELLYLAQRGKLSIHEVPVRWVEDSDSRVAILQTAIEDLRGIRRLRRNQPESVVQTGAPGRAAVPLTSSEGGGPAAPATRRRPWPRR